MNYIRAMYCMAAVISGSVQPARSCSPLNSVILFDLHGVLFKHEKGKMLWTWVANMPTIMKNIARLQKAYPFLKDAVKDGSALAANCQKPQELIWQLLFALKQHGYPIYLFSNILPETFEDLRKRYPRYMSSFDGYIIPGKDTGFKNKSHHEFFAYARERLGKDGHSDKDIYFFDDEAPNIAKALAHKWKCTLVTSPQQCVVSAQKYGLPIAVK